ncbi:flagellar hook-associated protein FlgL [Pseudobacteroides cellulosolvens]|uniref:Flagellar hook-associated protein 3 n=1 Tax=Pseudobacteroides cellulosolvens ATCC 35603 = DSM 2933 TaxID=398512 RepID=A0A0L6JS08_9FIRM|nr:flagellar hook-associated protein FlgL [Pseudobacteroides cellulosolvens]KNY28626.1 flagellar hook-associated protein 3 [Pseudobacteroides cellulosolvens ATCC 35603 = DSM 2933]
MRITNNMLINNMMSYINGNLGRMNKLQSQLATGKKISVPSDDPIVAAKALKLRTDVAEVEQFKRNSNDADSWMSITESSMGMVVDVLQRARELAVQAANGTMTPDDREKIRKEVEQLKDQIIHISNSTYAGRYVFSGFTTDTPLMNEDGTYKVSVGSNETAVIKSGLIDLSKIPIDNTSSNLSFQICLDGTNYKTVQLPAKNYDGALNSIDTLAYDIQSAINSFPELENVNVKNDGGRLEFSLKNTIDSYGNRMKMYIKRSDPEDLLDKIKLKTDPVTNITVSKSEEINYQIGINDNLNVNVLGTQLFGSGTKNDMGDFMISMNRFIDTLTRPNTNSFITGHNIAASVTSPLILTQNNQFNIKVDGMTDYTTITIPDPGGYTYDGTPGKTLNDMVSGIQTAIDADPSLFDAKVTVRNENGKLVFSSEGTRKITLMDGPANNNALSALKIYTNLDKTVTSQKGEEGIRNAITEMDLLRDRVMSVRSDIGARTNRIELTLNRLENDNINFTQLMSENEDADMAETIMNLKNEENVYKASLEGGARIIQPSLMDFLR